MTVRTHVDLTVLPHWATSTMTQYSTQSHHPNTELTSLGHILFVSPLVLLDPEPNSPSPACEARALPIRLLRPVYVANVLREFD